MTYAILFDELVIKYIKNNKYTFATYFIIICTILPLESILLPAIYSKLFDSARINSSKSLNFIFMIFIIWIFILTGLLTKQSLEAYIIPTHLKYVRSTIFKNLIDKLQENYKDIKIGEQIARLFELSRNMKDGLTSIISVMMPLSIALFVVAIYFIIEFPIIGIIMLFAILLILIISFMLCKESILVAAARENIFLEMAEKYSDTFGNLMNIYLNNTTNLEKDKQNNNEDKHQDQYKIQLNIQRNLYGTLTFIGFITFISILIIGYYQLQNKTITNNQYVTIIIIQLYFLNYLNKISSEFPQVILKAGVLLNSAPYLFDILNQSNKNNHDNIIHNGKIEFKDVYFKYPNNKEYILNNFNLHIPEKSKVAIIGRSGSGKTTSMKLLLRMNQINKGTIKIDKEQKFHIAEWKVLIVNKFISCLHSLGMSI